MIAERYIYATRSDWKRRSGRMARWIAWHCPRWLVIWCYIRVAANATTGEWSGSVPHDVSIMEAIRRWDGQRL